MARREIASCVYNSQELKHATLLLLAAFMQAYFNFIAFQLLIIAYAIQNIRRRRVIARRIRWRLWHLPRPVNSWFEVHYHDHTLPDDYFKQQLRVRNAPSFFGTGPQTFLFSVSHWANILWLPPMPCGCPCFPVSLGYLPIAAQALSHRQGLIARECSFWPVPSKFRLGSDSALNCCKLFCRGWNAWLLNEWMNECVFIYRTYHIVSQGGLQFFLSEIGRQLIKAPLAAAISPYLISPTHPTHAWNVQWNNELLRISLWWIKFQ